MVDKRELIKQQSEPCLLGRARSEDGRPYDGPLSFFINFLPHSEGL